VYAWRMRGAETVRKLVHTRRILLVYFYVVTATICNGSAHDTILKIEFILSLLHEAGIQPS